MLYMRGIQVVALLLPAISFGATEIYAPLNSGIVSALNVQSGHQAVTVAAGQSQSINVSPDGKTLYLNSTDNSISAVSVTSGQTIKTYSTTYPVFTEFLSRTPFAVSPDETTLVVGTCALDEDTTCQQGYVEAFDAASGVEVGIVSVGEEVSGIAISADSKTAYVTHYFDFDCGIACEIQSRNSSIPSNALTGFSLPSLTAGTSVTFSFSPGVLAIAPGSPYAYVGAPISSTGLAEVSLPNLGVTRQISQDAPRLALSSAGTLLSVGQPAYNTNKTVDTVTFYQVPGLTLIGTVRLPYYLGNGLAADPQGRYAYTGYDGTVYQVDSQTLSVSNSMATGAVSDLAISVSGSVLYPLLNYGSAIASFAEGSLQPSHLSVIAPSTTLATSPSGQVFYTTPSFPLSGIAAVSTAGKKLGTFATSNSFTSTALSSDGSTLYAAAESSLGGEPFELLVVSVQSGKVRATIPLANYPGQLALSPDQSKVIVNVATGLLIYNTATGKSKTVTLNGAFACAISPSGKIAYVQTVGGTVSIVSLDSATVVGEIAVLGGAIAFSPVGSVAFASGSNGDIAVIDTLTGAITSTIATTTVDPQAFAITPDGTYLYATGSGEGSAPGVVVNAATMQVVGNLPANGPITLQ